MWIFLPNAFYSLRAYDPEETGIPVFVPHVVVRTRCAQDLDEVRVLCPGAFDLPNGSDYQHHLAVPTVEWERYMKDQLGMLPAASGMKSGERAGIHGRIWATAMELEALDEGARERGAMGG